jgi:hypothetical protein
MTQQMHSFLLINLELQAPTFVNGDSHEKRNKETGVDIRTGSRPEDDGA